MATRRRCPACHQTFLRGRRALFQARTGPRMATVCQGCFDAGLTLVQDRTGNLNKCVECELNPAVKCSVCVHRAVLGKRERD